MFLSKLDPSPTSGSSSLVAFDGQNPFSDKQHPLLLPTALDIIFSYLTFAEVKSNRLVCKTWGEIGIPFIGRRNLEPVNFSDVSHKDFLALRHEFNISRFKNRSKPHPKLKLFQGFRLTWEKVDKMAYFMPSFKPSQLYISGKVMKFPSERLRALLQPIVATLRDLTFKIQWVISKSPPTFLVLRNLTKMGLTLKRLHLQIDESIMLLGGPSRKDGLILCRSLNNLLKNQAPFLEELSLDFECYLERNENVLENKIQFPIFPRLQTLALAIEFKTDQGRSFDTFQTFDFCAKFPNLLQLDLLDLVLSELALEGRTLDSTKGHPLKKLNIISSDTDSSTYEDNDFPIASLVKLGTSFPRLEEFSTQDIIPNRVAIPWVNTLKNLEIRGTSRVFNFLRLKKLEYLHYAICRDDINGGVNGLITSLLDHYAQLPHLKKIHISGLYISAEQMTLIQERLPAEFLAILTID